MIADKNRIIRLYLDGYKATDIAHVINEKPRTVQRILREFKKSLTDDKILIYEKVHKKNKKLISDDRKENKKIISDKEMALRNPSVYTVNRHGDWVLNKNNNYNYTLDMPLLIKNTEIREYRKTFINNKL